MKISVKMQFVEGEFDTIVKGVCNLDYYEDWLDFIYKYI